VGESWRRTHKDTAKPIGLKPIRELRELGVSKEFAPASQVEHGLRLEIRELNAGRPLGRYARNGKRHEKQERRLRDLFVIFVCFCAYFHSDIRT